ncbi:integrase [Thiocystis minor]|nr:integrase [Thiocystis minor]
MAPRQRDATASFAFYNHEHPHQSLGYPTPEEVYRSGEGEGAKIVDRVGETTLGQRQTAAIEVGSTT